MRGPALNWFPRDVLSSTEAVAFVRERLQRARGGDAQAAALDEVAEALVRHAIDDRRSSDNVSVVLARVVPPERDGGRLRPRGGGSGGGVRGGGGGQRSPLRDRAQNRADLPPAGVPSRPTAAVASPDLGRGSMNLLGLHSPSPDTHEAKRAAAAAVRQPVMPKAAKSLETDEDLMDFLLDDKNFD